MSGIPSISWLTVCDSIRKRCPVFLGAKRQIHSTFDDPDMPGFPEAELLETFRRVRDEIEVITGEFPDAESQL
jgi:hypothetical protein